MYTTIDTRDLIEERDDLQEQILEEFNDRFNTELINYYDIDIFLNDEVSEDITQDEMLDFKSHFSVEIERIQQIDDLEGEISSSEFNHGITLIEDIDFIRK